MFEEILFRILFLLIFAIFGGFRIYYRRKSRQYKKPEDEQQKGKRQRFGWAEIILSIGILGMLISMVLYLIIPPWIPWFPLPIPSILRWIGVSLGFSVIPFLIWIHRTLGQYYSAVLEIKEKHTLITIGPYARIRHPMYTVFILYTFSILLLAANLLVTIFTLMIISMFYPVSKKEEQMLIGEFSDQYREYMKRTGRFFPRIRQQKKGTETNQQS